MTPVKPNMDSLPVLSGEELSEIETCGILTGSTLFQKHYKTETTLPNQKPSDIDYIIHLDGVPGSIYARCDLRHSDAYGGGTQPLYFRTEDGRILNLIVCGDSEVYEAWQRTTEAMELLFTHCYELNVAMQFRPNRIAVFKALRDSLLNLNKRVIESPKDGGSFANSFTTTN
jgi:hypothetical protein